MKTMVNNLIAAFRERLQKLDWMSDETRKQAIAKLDAFGQKIGYPDKWIDYSTLNVSRDSYLANVLRSSEFEQTRDFNKINKPVDRKEWGMTPPTVNAGYNPLNNDISFPGGNSAGAILQPERRRCDQLRSHRRRDRSRDHARLRRFRAASLTRRET